MIRREFTGGAERTNLTANINNSVLSFTVVDGSTYPSGQHPFVVVIDRGLTNEEKILISSRANNVFTVSTRGFDGTAANTHDAGSFVDHVLDAVALQDMNNVTYDSQVLVWMGV
jgi:hypothetical protein